MQQQTEQELQQRLAQIQLQKMPVIGQGNNVSFQQQMQTMTQSQVNLFEEMEITSQVQEESKDLPEGSIDTMQEARNQRKKNKMMANTIRNQSAMNSQSFD